MEFGIRSNIAISVYTLIIFQVGKSFGYKAARDDLVRIVKPSDSDS